MSIFTIKRHLLFVRIVCGWFLLYNIQAANEHYISTNQPTQSSGLGFVVDFFWSLERYAHYYIVPMAVLTLVNLAGVVLSIGGLMLKSWARSWLIVAFYLTILIKALQFGADASTLYWSFSKHLKPGSFADVMLYTFMYFQSVFNIPILIALLFWIIKQFKSQPIKNLFQQKSAPEISGTL